MTEREGAHRAALSLVGGMENGGDVSGVDDGITGLDIGPRGRHDRVRRSMTKT